jgi:hypothetical protein
MSELKIPARFDEEDALDLTIKLWEWIAETGSNRKQAWPGWAKFPYTFTFYCPLCQYAEAKDKQDCLERCPWARSKGQRCIDSPNGPTTNYSAWVGADQSDPAVRSAYARSFLAELKEIRKEMAR